MFAVAPRLVCNLMNGTGIESKDFLSLQGGQLSRFIFASSEYKVRQFLLVFIFVKELLDLHVLYVLVIFEIQIFIEVLLYSFFGT